MSPKTVTRIRIDKGVPIPAPAAAQKYPMRDLEIGDSFFVPTTNIHGTGLYNSARRAGIRITLRKVDGGLRCWRTQ